jgi:hypothetical protein
MKSQSFLRRILTSLSKFPWSLGIALGLLIFIAPHPDWHGDLTAFRVAEESLRHPYYARWLFYLLRVLPEPVAYILLEGICTALLYFAVRVWKGKHWMMFFSFQYAWTLFYGQIDGIVVGGLALAWWALENDRFYWMGLGLILASIKPQMALPLGLAIWWWSKNRWKPLLIPALVLAASFLQWGFWIPAWFQGLFHTEDLVQLSRNVSMWTLAGFWIWLIWIPVLWLPLPRPRKLVAIVASTMITVPYFPLSSAVLVLGTALPWPFWAALQLPALGGFGLGYGVYDLMRLVPIAILGWAAWPVVNRLKSPPR